MTTDTTHTVFDRDYQRGQTTLDLVAGLTLLFAVLVFTVMFLPTIIDPFKTSGEGSPALADRGADQLTQNILREKGQPPYVLDSSCTTAFFNGTPNASCNDVTTNNINKIVGHGQSVNVYVTLSNDIGIVREVGESPQDIGGTNTFIATRIVTIENKIYTFKYYVW